ncbi:MAG: class II aldolase/adducin family protein [Actinobacteria bacterium]|nr:class II aldolase/adducin family protein [Actinomycetota bacterium]
MEKYSIAEELAVFANEVYQRKLVGSAGGNISYRLSENRFLVSPTNSCLGRIKPDEFVVIDENCNLIEGAAMPTKEAGMHLSVFKVREDVNCIIHTHSPYATVFACMGLKIPMITVSAKLKLIDTPIVRYADPGSSQLRKMVEDVVSKSDRNISCILLNSHGLLALGSTPESAFNIAELAEDTANIAYLVSSMQSFAR